LVHATRKEDRRLSAALLAAALAHTPEAAEAINGARARMARKPAALARELLRNFPKGRRGKNRRRTRKPGEGTPAVAAVAAAVEGAELDGHAGDELELEGSVVLLGVESGEDPAYDDAEDDDVDHGSAEASADNDPEDDDEDDDDFDTDDTDLDRDAA
jgi:hypothetical protein